MQKCVSQKVSGFAQTPYFLTYTLNYIISNAPKRLFPIQQSLFAFNFLDIRDVLR